MSSEQWLVIGIIFLCLTVGIPKFIKLLKWAEKEDEKNMLCPKCGKQLRTDNVDVNSICTIFSRSCPGPDCDYQDKLRVPVIDPLGNI